MCVGEKDIIFLLQCLEFSDTRFSNALSTFRRHSLVVRLGLLVFQRVFGCDMLK